MIRVLVFLFFSLFFNLVFAQSVTYSNIQDDFITKFDRYSTKDGLSDHKCTSIYQDRYGFLWIGTQNGLNRFDGYNFIQYMNNPDDSTSISGNFISDITEDPMGNLWIATQNGLNIYDRKTESFTRFVKQLSKNSISDNNIRKFISDENEFLWIETLDGTLNQLDLREKTFKHYRHSKIIQPFYTYYGMLKDEHGMIWTGGRNFGPGYFNPRTETFTQLEAQANTPGKKRDPGVACYFLDSHQTFWVSSIDGIYTLDRETNYFSKFLGTTTYSMCQSEDGNIWFATGNGAFRFNYETQILTHFVHDENNPFSIIDNHVNEVFQDKDHNIWFATNKGLCQLNNQKNRFGHVYHIPENENSLASNRISSLAEDHQGNVYIGFENKGFDKFNLNDQSFEHYQKRNYPNLKSDKVSSLYFDKSQELWVGLWSGLGFSIFDPNTKQFKAFSYDPHTRKRDWYSDFSEDQNGTHWVGIWGASGLHQFDKEKGTFIDKVFTPLNQITNQKLNKVFCDNQNNVWIGNENQILYKYNSNEEAFSAHIHKDYQVTPERLEDLKLTISNFSFFNKTEDIIQDEHGNIWFITNTNIIRYNSNEDSFNWFELKALNNRTYISSSQKGSWFISNHKLSFFSFAKQKFETINIRKDIDVTSIKKILQTNKNDFLWTSKDKIYSSVKDSGSFQLIFSKDQIKNVFIDSGNQIWIFTPKDIAILDPNLNESRPEELITKISDSEVYSFYESPGSVFWIGTNNGLFKVDQINRVSQYLYDPDDKNAIMNNKIYSISSDGGSSLWLATETGLCKYDIIQDLFSAYNDAGDGSLTSHLVGNLLEDSKGELWIGTTNKGLNKLNTETGKLEHFRNRTYDSASISSDIIQCIFEDDQNNIWVGTKDGLNLLRKNQSSFVRYYEEDGLASNSILSITQDNSSILWIATDHGLTKFDFSLNKFCTYYETDGLQGNSYSTSLKLNDGRLVLGGENGLNIFDPCDIKPVENKINIQLASLSVFEKIFKTDLTATESIILTYKENFFTLHFSSLSFINPAKQTYLYQLEGIDPDWNKVIGEPKASYTDIGPGNYTFKVKAIADNGIESDEKVLEIIIVPPFWLTYWFLSLMLAAVIAIVSWIILLRFKKYKAEIEKAEIEQRMLRTQMNPHFIFNALTSIQNFIYGHDAQNADKFLTKFARLLRLILENSRSTYINIADEEKTIYNYLELQKLRFDNSFTYSISIDPKIDKETICIPPMLGQPFIENSIEHGFVDQFKKHKLNIKIWIVKHALVYTIEDNGIGIIKSTEAKKDFANHHKSLGMQITKDRIHNLKKVQKQNITLKTEDLSEDHPGKTGTKVTLIIPLKYAKDINY